MGETGLPATVVGTIDIRERHLFVDVATEHVNGILSKLSRARLKDRRVKVKRCSRVSSHQPVTPLLPRRTRSACFVPSFAGQVYIARESSAPALRNRLLRLAAFQNPEFCRGQSMRLPTYDKPPAPKAPSSPTSLASATELSPFRPCCP